MDDEKIIELFWKRDEQAIRAAMDRYGAYCRSVADRILPVPEDAEEAVCDTWQKAWDAMPPSRPACLRLFLGRITRNAAVSIYRRNNAYFRGSGQTALALEELGQIVSDDTPDATVDAKELGRMISAFLGKEPAMRRAVFLRRYFYMEEIPEIANRYGLREANVRMMLSRTRQKLKIYLIQEGYSL